MISITPSFINSQPLAGILPDWSNKNTKSLGVHPSHIAEVQPLVVFAVTPPKIVSEVAPVVKVTQVSDNVPISKVPPVVK